MVKRSPVVVVNHLHHYSTKLPSDTALKTFAPTVESRNSDQLLTPTYVFLMCLDILNFIMLFALPCLILGFSCLFFAVRSQTILIRLTD